MCVLKKRFYGMHRTVTVTNKVQTKGKEIEWIESNTRYKRMEVFGCKVCIKGQSNLSQVGVSYIIKEGIRDK